MAGTRITATGTGLRQRNRGITDHQLIGNRPTETCPSCDGQPNNHNKTIHYTQEVPVLQTQSIEFPNPMIAIIVIQFTIHLLTITPSHHHAYTYSPPAYSHLDYSLTD